MKTLKKYYNKPFKKEIQNKLNKIFINDEEQTITFTPKTLVNGTLGILLGITFMILTMIEI